MKRNDAIVAMLGPLIKFDTQPTASWYKAKAASDELVLVDDAGKEQIGFLSRYSALMKSINLGSIRFVYADKADADEARKRYRDFLKQESLDANSSQELSVAQDSTAGTPVVQAEVEEAVSLLGPTESQVESLQLTLGPPRPDVKNVQRDLIAKKGVQDAV
jgi:hypothetical protein